MFSKTSVMEAQRAVYNSETISALKNIFGSGRRTTCSGNPLGKISSV